MYKTNKKLTIILTVFLILIVALPAFAASKPEATYLIDKHGNQRNPVIAGNIMVYEDRFDDNQTIFIHNFSTNQAKNISGVTNRQYAPHTDGKYVVWIDKSYSVQSIYLYNIATDKSAKITTVPSEKRNPKVAYPWVIWSDYRENSWDIYAYNITTKETKRVAKHNYNSLGNDDKLGITISGDRIVWTDFRNQNWDLYGADLKTGKEFPVVIAPKDQRCPSLEGDNLVYQDNTDFTNNIYFFDFKTSKSKLICGAAKDQENPQISGNMIVWQDFRNQRWDIYGYDLTAGKEEALVSKHHDQLYPSISGDRVVFVDNSKSREDIGLLNLAKGGTGSGGSGTVGTGTSEGIKIMINGRLLPTDIAPVMKNGRILIPVRAVGEALGLTVNWDSTTQQINLLGNGKNVELKIGSKTATINGQKTQLDTPADTIQGRTLVPLRFVGEAFEAKVNWDGGKQLVEIVTTGTVLLAPAF